MPISGQLSIVCSYCGMEKETVSLNTLSRLKDWFVLSPAGDINQTIGENTVLICRKCKLHTDELTRIARWKIQQKLNPPPPDDLLPEQDLPDSEFLNDLPNPEIACLGTSYLFGDRLPPELRVRNPLWTKKPT